MSATAILRHEHDIILLVLNGVERGARALDSTLASDAEWLDTIVDLVRNFADRCHHGKEERHLFVRLEERGVRKAGGPIGAMLREHEQGRALVRSVAEATPAAKSGEARARQSAAEGLLAYAELLRAHIAKENQGLFPLADQVLSAEDQAELVAAFDRVEAEEMGEGTHERYHELAHKLAEQ